MSGIRKQKLVFGGRILDIDGNLDQPPAADILIEDGHISAIGRDATVRAARDNFVQRIDASDKLIIPGLINSHYHSHDVMLRGMFEQMPLDAWFLYSSPSNYPRPSQEDVRLRTSLGAAECLMNGITTVQDMVTVVGPDRQHVESILSSYGQSGIRVVLGLQISDRAAVDCVPFWRDMPAAIVDKLPKASDQSEFKKLIEELLSEDQASRVRWALAPSAPQRCSEELLTWVATLARQYGLQVVTHLYEARSQAVLARIEYPNGSLLDHLEKFGLLGPNLTVAHGVWISGEEIDRFGSAGANLAFNPMSNMKLLNGFAPILHYARSGAGVGLGCDNCSGNDVQSLFQSMKMFALFWGMYSEAGETGAAREAFKAATVGGARALGLATEIGLLRPGYRADLVMIDLNEASYRPLNSAVRQLVYSETGTGVHTVMVDGEIVVENRKLKAFSQESLKRQSEIVHRRMAEDVRALYERNKEILRHVLCAYEKANQYPLNFDRFSMRLQF